MTPFPISMALPAEHAGPLPAQADVVVIGGGIIGVMTVWELAKAGLRAVLVEKGRVAGEQSSRNWGWIRAQGRDPAELPIMLDAARRWRDLAAGMGDALGLRQTGVMYLADKPEALAGFEAWLPHARTYGLDTRVLGGAEVAALMPAAAKRWAGAMWTASDMRAEPWLAVPALARAAVADGAVIVEGCAARLIDVAAGRVAGVVTEQGRIAAPAVVLAGGAWSSLLLRRHGISLPQLSVRTSVAVTAPLPEIFAGGARDSTLAWRRRVDGGYTLAPRGKQDLYIGPDAFRALRAFVPQLRADPWGTRLYPAAPSGYPDGWGTPRRWDGDRPSPFEAMRILNPPPHAGDAARLVSAFAARFPTLGPVRLRSQWGGMIDTMPDLEPVVDHAASLPGLVIATGMSGHGFGIGPAIGAIVAALVQGRAPGHDLHRFRLGRFTGGAPIAVGPSV